MLNNTTTAIASPQTSTTFCCFHVRANNRKYKIETLGGPPIKQPNTSTTLYSNQTNRNSNSGYNNDDRSHEVVMSRHVIALE